MGKIHPDLAGAYTRSVGNVVYYLKDGENFARTKSKAPYTSNTPAQQEQKGKFSDLSQLGSVMQEVAKVGLVQRKRGLSAINAFHSVNKDCFTQAEGEKASIDYENLKCSQGPLYPPVVTATLDNETSTVAFNCPAMPDATNCNAKDVVYGVLLDTENGFCHLLRLCDRGEGGTAQAVLSAYWNTDAIVAYAFVVSNNGRKASKTLFVSVS